MSHRQRLAGAWRRCQAARGATRLAVIVATSGLVACATSPAPAPDAPLPEPAAPAAAAASGADVGASAAAYRLVVEAPGDLRNLLQTYLDLGRFQGAADSDRITSGELNRLIAAAPAQARSLLETEGYFKAVVTVERGEGDDTSAEGAPQVVVKVTPGPRVEVQSWSLDVQGALRQQADAGQEEALALLSQLRSRWPLKDGDAFRQPAWSAAKNTTLARLRAEGYPTASWAPATTAHVNAATQEATLQAVIDSGPLFRLGALRIEGLARYDESAIRNVADFDVGTIYTEKRMLDFQERLTKVGLFESVSVEIDPDPAVAAATPVTVKVREQTLQQAITGVGFSDNTGPRVTLEHRHRRPFGWNVQAHNKFEIGRDLRSWEGELITHPNEGQYRNLLAGSISRLDTAGDVTIASRARIGRLLETERVERLVFAEVINSATTNAQGKRTSQAVSGNYHWVWRNVDSVLLPTEGWTASAQTAAGFSHANFADSGPFGRLHGRVIGYWPLGRAWYSSLRVEAAQIISKPTIGLPEALLFRAGGDDSVRGYPYRTLGPVVDGTLTSGRHLFTASAEIARPFSERRPALWWAVFVDAGNAANKWQELDPALGYGVGVRWRSPVGPLRIDIARGQEVHKTRLHLSVGIAF